MHLSSLFSIILINDKQIQEDFYTQKFKPTPVREKEGIKHQENTSAGGHWDGPARMSMLSAHRSANPFGATVAFILSCIDLLGGNLFLLSFLPSSKMAHFIPVSSLGKTMLLTGTLTGQYPSCLVSSLCPLPSPPFPKTTDSLLQGNPILPACLESS